MCNSFKGEGEIRWLMAILCIISLSGCITIPPVVPPEEPPVVTVPTVEPPVVIEPPLEPYPAPPDVPYYITNDPNDVGKQKIDCCPEIGYMPEGIDPVVH